MRRIERRGIGPGQAGSLDHLSHQRIAIGMHAGGGKAEDDVARRDIGARQDAAALGSADRKAREIVVAGVIEARHLGGFAADQRAARKPATLRDARDDRRAGLWIQLSAGEIVEKEKRLCALHHEVVDRHGNQVDADRVMAGRSRSRS